MRGTRGTFQDGAQLGDLDRGLEVQRIDLLDGRGEEQVDAGLLGKQLVALEVARVAGQVLGGPKLRRVDEQARHSHVALLVAGPKERQVALVEGAHGGDESDRPARPTRSVELGAQRGDRADGLHATSDSVRSTSASKSGSSCGRCDTIAAR